MIKLQFFILLLTVAFISPLMSQTDYALSIEKWRKERLQSLTAPKSWSSLFGLFWLEKDETSLGANKSFDVVLPELLDEHMGKIQISDNTILFKQFDTEKYLEKIRIIRPDQDVVEAGRYLWSIINRNGKLGLRVWDIENPNRQRISSLPYYPINDDYLVNAQFTGYYPPKEQILTNVLGMKINQKIYGKIDFELNGKSYQLDAYDGGDNQYFIIFGDLSNGEETYGGGRYLYCAKENEKGYILLDFNKAFTPPCGFTDYATCLLPAPENTMDILVKAGEKYDLHH